MERYFKQEWKRIENNESFRPAELELIMDKYDTAREEIQTEIISLLSYFKSNIFVKTWLKMSTKTQSNKRLNLTP